MPAGLTLTKGDIDAAVGQALRELNISIKHVEDLRDGVQAYTDDELVALGYTPGEVTLVRNALNDMDLLWKIYRGAQPLPAAQDFRQSAKKLWGLGVS